MTRSKKFFYNTVFSALYQVIVMVTGMILPRVMLTYFGSEVNGLTSSITQFVACFTLVEGGLSQASVFALYQPLAQKDHSKINGVMAATKRFYSSSGWIFLLLMIVLALGYPTFASVKIMKYGEIAVLVLILGASGILDFFTLGKYRAILTADQCTYIVSFASIVYCIINTLLIVGMAVMGASVVAARAIALFAVLIRSFILMLYCKKKYPYLDYDVTPNFLALNKRWNALFLQILGMIQQSAPVILVTLFTSLKTVSVYSIYNMIMGGISGILDIFTNGLSASFGDVIVRKENETLHKAYNDFEFVFYALITAVFSIAMVMTIPFVELYTKEITDAVYVQPCFAFLCVLNGYIYQLKTPQGMLVISAGLYKETRWRSTLQAAILIVTGIALTPRMGLNGIWIAGILSNIYRVVDLVFYIPKKVTGLPVSITLKRIAYSVCNLVLIVLIANQLPFACASFSAWFVYAICTAGISFVVITISTFVMDYQSLKTSFARVKQIFKN